MDAHCTISLNFLYVKDAGVGAGRHSVWKWEIWVQVPVWREQAIQWDQGLRFNRFQFPHLQNENLQCGFFFFFWYVCIIIYYFMKQAWIKWSEAFSP